MTERKWTPGPWEYDPDEPNSHDVYSAKGFHIGRATPALGEMGAESKHNAILWASAPELYEALMPYAKEDWRWGSVSEGTYGHRVCKDCKAVGPHDDSWAAIPHKDSCRFRMACIALAKAEDRR